MSHRIDLKMLGYKGKKYGTKEEVLKLANTKLLDNVEKKIVKAPKGKWELYAKK